MRFLTILCCALFVGVSAQYGAVEAAEGLSPRYYLGTSEEIQKRQAGVCHANEHSCLDVNSTTACCENSEYCVINKDYSAGCCAIGSNCNLPCGSLQWQCASTVTISGKATVSPACCQRSCSTSSYKCAGSLGGGCCAFGFECEADGKCASTVPPTSTNPAIVTGAPSQCAASQITCAASVGGGCCGLSSTCTVSNSEYYCAAPSETAQRTGADGSTGTGISKTTKKSGLSSGAKAGIGGGIAGIILVLVGGILYFCLRQRRNSRSSSESSSAAPEMSQKSGSAATRPRPSPARRQTADYFGPNASAGPYTDDNESPGTSPGLFKGVPLTPHSPSDIATAVEIDSRDHSNVTTPGAFVYEKIPNVKEHPFELP